MEKVMKENLPIMLHGQVGHGRKLGSSLNMPTANIVPREDVSKIMMGVYYSKVYVDDNVYKGITNVGKKPTVKESSDINVETFVYDFSGDLYDKEISVELLDFRRPEIKFDSVEELSACMKDDIEAGREY